MEQSEEKEEFGKEEWSEVEQTEEDEQLSKEDEERVLRGLNVGFQRSSTC